MSSEPPKIFAHTVTLTAEAEALLKELGGGSGSFAQVLRDGIVALKVGRELQKILRGRADHAYCDYIYRLRRPECLGWEEKVRTGKFGSAELNAHVRAHEKLGEHRAYSEALVLLAQAVGVATAPQIAGAGEFRMSNVEVKNSPGGGIAWDASSCIRDADT